jgi:hypothetical protein
LTLKYGGERERRGVEEREKGIEGKRKGMNPKILALSLVSTRMMKYPELNEVLEIFKILIKCSKYSRNFFGILTNLTSLLSNFINFRPKNKSEVWGNKIWESRNILNL